MKNFNPTTSLQKELWHYAETTNSRDEHFFKARIIKRQHNKGALEELKTEIDQSVQQHLERWSKRPILIYPPNLPILEVKESIIQALTVQSVIVVAADTGSGKSTQLPKFCLEAGCGFKGKIAMVQPRRIGAISIAKRIADELKEPLGNSIGYRIRFDDKSSPNSFIRIMTDGLLLAELQGDPLLLEYDAIIVDEAHERSLNIDLLLGLLRGLTLKRPTLKIIISSATLDTEKFSLAFNNCQIITAQGRMFPVELRYRPLPSGADYDLTVMALMVVNEILSTSYQGDILVFMPTEEEINNLIQAIITLKSKQALLALPLFARLSAAEQRKIFDPFSGRKIIVSTNIAETTLTITGISYVIDSGLARLSQYNSSTRIQSLPVVAISQASANQRKGRCGRLGDGICYRLYSQDDFESRSPFTLPEIQRSNLAESILRMLSLNIQSIESFPFIDRPADKFFGEAFKALYELGAITGIQKEHRKLTARGRLMASLPIDPRLSRIIIEANEEGALDEAVIICAALSMQDIRERPSEKVAAADAKHKAFSHGASDFLFYVNLHQKASLAYSQSASSLRRFCKENFISYKRSLEWFSLQSQLTTLLREKGFKASSITTKDCSADPIKGFGEGYTALHKALLSGYLNQFALLKVLSYSFKKEVKLRHKNNSYLMAGGKEASIFPASSLWNGEWPTIFSGMMLKTSKLYGRYNAAFQLDWLLGLAQDLINYRPDRPHWSAKKGEVLCYEKAFFYGILISGGSTVSYKKYDKEAARDLFIKEVLLADEVDDDLQKRFVFLKSNVALCQKLSTLEDKLRRRDLFLGNDALFSFYQQRLPNIAGFVDLQEYIKSHGFSHLLVKESDLIASQSDYTIEHYPDHLIINNKPIPLSYRFNPGHDDDGYSLILSPEEARHLNESFIEWGPLAFFYDKLLAMAKALPRGDRIKLHPTTTTCLEIASNIKMEGSLFTALECYIKEHYHQLISRHVWQAAEEKIAEHLRMRYAVKASDGSIALATRQISDLTSINVEGISKQCLQQQSIHWEQIDLKLFPSVSIEKAIELTDHQGKSIGRAYPALTALEGRVDLKLYNTINEAELIHPLGVALLIQKIMKSELTAIKKVVESPKELIALNYLGGSRSFDRDWFNAFLRRHLELEWYQSAQWSVIGPSFTQQLWHMAEQEALATQQALQYYDKLRRLLAKFSQKHPHLQKKWEALRQEADHLVTFDDHYTAPSAMLLQLGRYMKSLIIRSERMAIDPAKEDKKATEYIRLSLELSNFKGQITSYRQQKNYNEACYLLKEFQTQSLTPDLKGGSKITADDISSHLS